MVGGAAALITFPCFQRHIILGVSRKASEMVLSVSGGEFYSPAIGRIQVWPVGDADPVHVCHRLEPGDQRCVVGHVTDIHMAWGINH